MTDNSPPPVGSGAVDAAALLADAVAGAADADGERRALAAYRAARDSGAFEAEPRRGDDWRGVPAGRGGDTP